MKLITYIFNSIKSFLKSFKKKEEPLEEDYAFDECLLRTAIGFDCNSPTSIEIITNQTQGACIIREGLGLDCEDQYTIEDADVCQFNRNHTSYHTEGERIQIGQRYRYEEPVRFDEKDIYEDIASEGTITEEEMKNIQTTDIFTGSIFK